MTKTIIIIGKMGVGKTSVAHKLESKGFQKVRTYTTRPPRNMQDFNDYKFLNEEEFRRMKSAGVFAEDTEFEKGGKMVRYASAKEDYRNDEKNIIILDVPGLKNVLNSVGHDNLYVVYLKAEPETLLDRLEERGTEDISYCKKRLRREETLFDGLSADDVDLFVNTDDLTIKEVATFINNEYQKHVAGDCLL